MNKITKERKIQFSKIFQHFPNLLTKNWDVRACQGENIKQFNERHGYINEQDYGGISVNRRALLLIQLLVS